ncbi:MAG: alpha/beta hydrolase [Okeania sp. SIO3B5]|uniref:alpha/beta fold hydrolase n=1 Tax=Okeania sp. SIO3B5 TaxID=2607811 RepID=UPI0013FF331B|nr:alpha/beta hydrolase [Okeania sp. SIO3B5]NEO58710.1 alpha/beta hydrolase [Okeania sp. SIO3B5]
MELKPQKIEISTQNIAYYESSGKGQTIFLIHGNSSSGRSYLHQLQGKLGETYRLIAMDLPGHGLSDVAANPEVTYSLPGYASAVVEVAKALDASNAIFVGWSLGGHILLEASDRLTDAKGIVIFGTPPIANNPPNRENAFLPHPSLRFGFTAELSQEDMLAYVTTFFRPGIVEIPELFLEDIALTDGRARSNYGASITPTGYQNEIEIVGNMKIPLMIIHGEQEQLVRADYIAELKMPTLWNGEIKFIANAGHAPHWETPGKFNSLLMDFIADVTIGDRRQ